MSSQPHEKKSLSRSAASTVRRLVRFEKIRFALVGILNTFVDFVILFTLVGLFGMPSLVANIISTSVALAVSYLLNKKAVFGNTDTHNHRQIIFFIIVTLSGLWVLQSLVITGVTTLLHTWLTASDGSVLFVAKLVATFFSLTWNYLWYSRAVFKKENS